MDMFFQTSAVLAKGLLKAGLENRSCTGLHRLLQREKAAKITKSDHP
jgi:hypothetical protein